MGAMAPTRSDASAKWLAPGSGEQYERARFRSSRARNRDAACVQALLDRACGQGRIARLLDVPCGSGRLTPVLAARANRYLGVDISREMLESAAPAFRVFDACALAIQADGLALPLSSGQFDVVVACRWLHHLHEGATLDAAIAELVRVSRNLVIASFWDEHSLPGWRRRLQLKRAEGSAGRVATGRDRIQECFDQAGADVVAWRTTLRFVAQQTFVAARVRHVRG